MGWLSGFESICQADVPLADCTWYRLGGPARWVLEPHDEPQLAALLCRLRDEQIPWRILGRGANVLVRDEGFPGAVIRLRGPCFEEISIEEDGVIAAAGVDFPHLIRQTLEAGRCGLEVLAGIPGSLGGVIRMNAGGRYGEISRFVEQVSLVDSSGNLFTRRAAELSFRYRHAELNGAVALGARLRLPAGDRQAALDRYREIWQEKSGNQPPLAARSAGCIFKNPAQQSAGRLLDAAGLKGVRIGSAEISTRHANFILAHPGARAAHVLDLIALARDRVWNLNGIKLELEIDIW